MGEQVLLVSAERAVAAALAAGLRVRGWRANVVAPGHRLSDAVVRAGARAVVLEAVPGRAPVAQVARLRGRTDVWVAGDGDVGAVVADCLSSGAAGVVDTARPLGQLVEVLDRELRQGPAEPGAREALAAGIRAHAGTLRAYDRAVATLTDAERRVLADLRAGATAETIAAHRSVSLTTVRTQIAAVLRKLGVHSQLAAAALATQRMENRLYPQI